MKYGFKMRGMFSICGILLLAGCSFGPGKIGKEAAPFLTSQIGPSAALKNFRQFYEGLSVQTGVPADSGTTSQFNDVRSRLSQDGDGLSVSTGMIFAVGRLAGEFCNKLIDKDRVLVAADRRVFNAVNFTQTQSGLTPAVRQDVFKKLYQIFLNREPLAGESAILNTAMDEALVGQAQSTTQTRSALLVACAAVAASMENLQP